MFRPRLLSSAPVSGLFAAGLAVAACAQDDVTIEATDLGAGLFMLVGQGGNIGLSLGPDGAFMIDDQFAPLTPKIEAKIAELNADFDGGVGAVRFIVNTHFHGDHTGGNAEWAAKGATIVAHDAVRANLIAPPMSDFSPDRPEASPAAGWPVVTFNAQMTFHLNGETVKVIHVPNAHTDGDAIVHFVERDVVHMGDTFFNGLFPYIHVAGGGSVDGYLAAQDAVLAMANADTVIIPGHGPLARKTDLQTMRDVLAGARDAVQAQIDAGKSVQDAVAAKPLAVWDTAYGQAFIKSDKMVEILYASLTAEHARQHDAGAEHGHAHE